MKRGALESATLAQRVFQRLDDREFRSGEALASQLEVTRAAVWKAVEQLRELGLDLDAAPHRGYRLRAGVTPLDRAQIEAQLAPSLQALVESIDVGWTLESTNTELLGRKPPRAGLAHVLLAEHQTGGRGRRGRSWIAPPGGALCLSIGWQFPDMPADLSALSLVVGVQTRAALESLGLAGLRLKWPNDLITERGKLGGILIELRAEGAGPAYVVIGIGLNVVLDDSARVAVKATGAAADDVASCGAAVPDRNRLAAALLTHLLPALEKFPHEGFTPWLSEWHAADALHGVEVQIESGGERVRGIAKGVDAHGALLLETPGGLQRFVSGEVSVRKVS